MTRAVSLVGTHLSAIAKGKQDNDRFLKCGSIESLVIQYQIKWILQVPELVIKNLFSIRNEGGNLAYCFYK